jgi:phosphatidylglycerol---prolipoprotein diacylglyceryl transferase
MVTFFPSREVALGILGLSIHWYGVMYLLAFLLAGWMLPRLQKLRSLDLSTDAWASLLSWAIIGVIVGGRLGFVLFYEPGYFLSEPSQIVAVWRGGMSVHGGIIGVVVALFFALRKQKGNILKIADIAVVPVAIGLALGRVGNFINQELYGTPTNLPWAIAIPGVEELRHPLQLYAVCKDLLIAAVCFWHLKRKTNVIPGRTCALFLMLYGVLRFLLEYIRAQDYAYLDLGVLLLSRGQLLTLPVLCVGVWMWWKPGRSLRQDSG